MDGDLNIGPALKALFGELAFRVAQLETENALLKQAVDAQDMRRPHPLRPQEDEPDRAD